MALHAYIDDSVDHEGGYFVLAGHIATAESWGAFAREWAELLPWGTRRESDGRYHFKMNEMAVNAERMSRVPAFFRVIERHVLMSVSCAYRLSDLESAKRRIWSPTVNIDWGMADLRYLFGWRLLMDMFHTRKDQLQKIIPVEQKIDFHFDDQSEKKQIISAWDEYIQKRPESTKDRYGATPRFEDDMEFLPLQAADFWAWWVRKWYQDGTPDKIGTGDFGSWKVERSDYARAAIHFTEDQIIEDLVRIVHQEAGPGHQVFVAMKRDTDAR